MRPIFFRPFFAKKLAMEAPLARLSLENWSNASEPTVRCSSTSGTCAAMRSRKGSEASVAVVVMTPSTPFSTITRIVLSLKSSSS
jgi:hypothetical protein